MPAGGRGLTGDGHACLNELGPNAVAGRSPNKNLKSGPTVRSGASALSNRHDADIDVHDYEAVDWAVAWRVNAGEDDITVYPANWGAGLDPSVRRRDANVHLFGTGKWNRVLTDATVNLDYEPERGGERYPPTVRPSDDDLKLIEERWDTLGLSGCWNKQLSTET